MGRGTSKVGGDSTRGSANSQSRKSKIEAFADDIADFFNIQVGIDINQYRDSTTKGFDSENVINIDWNAIPKTQQTYLLQAINKPYSPYSAQRSGTWMWSIMKKRG